MTAGADAPQSELIFINAFGTLTISAAITDNPGGPVGVTTAGAGATILWGDNTYTGPTIVNETDDLNRLVVARPEAVPENNDVVINGANYRVNFDTDVPLRLRSLLLRDGGVLSSQYGSGGKEFDVTINADAYYLEGGSIRVHLAGDGPLVKTTDASSDLGKPSPQYHGDIDIYGGELNAYSQDYLGAGQTRVHSGGRLDLKTRGSAPGNVVPAGGELTPGGDGFRVTADSRILCYGPTPREVFGPVAIEPGAALDVIGPAGLITRGDVTLAASAVFASANNHVVVEPSPTATVSGAGRVEGTVIVAHGAALAPGASIGEFVADHAVWGKGGRYVWEIADATGVPGVDVDHLAISGELAATSTPGAPFTARVASVGATGNPSAAGQFDATET